MRKKSRKKTKDIAFCGVVTALAMVLGYLEHLVPLPIGIYGVKLGLANLSVLFLLYCFDVPTALTVHALRIFLSGLLFGNTVSLIYSVCGGFFSFAVMAILKKTDRFGTVGVSVAGGVCHNMAQLAAAAWLVDNLKIALYFPVLLICGALAGFAVGLCVLALLHHPFFRKLSEQNEKNKSEKES